MESLPLKTPVSVLQELLARRGTVPKYELVQIEGMIHEPTFRYRVTVADLVGMYLQVCTELYLHSRPCNNRCNYSHGYWTIQERS